MSVFFDKKKREKKAPYLEQQNSKDPDQMLHRAGLVYTICPSPWGKNGISMKLTLSFQKGHIAGWNKRFQK